MMQVAYATPIGAGHVQDPATQFVAQHPKHLAVEANYHEESSASASGSSTEREQGSMSSSSSSSGILSTRFPDNWQTPVVKFRVRRTVTKKSTHPIAEARLKKEREEKAKAAQKANGGSKRQTGGSKRQNGGGKRQTDGGNGNMTSKPMRPALPTMPKVANICAGMEVTGIVTSVHEFGVFMDIGWKRDAFLHKSEVYQKGSCDPATEFEVGQQFAVWVVEIFEGDDTRPARAGLSLVSPTGKIYFRDLSEGDTFLGEVTRVLSFGLIVEFGAQVDGMIHQSELYDLPENFNVGDTLDVEVKYLDQEARRVSLRLPEESGYVSMSDLKVGQQYRGKVVRHRTSGIVVVFSAGFEGFLHVSELHGEPADFAFGDMIEVEIKGIDRQKGRISLRRHTSPTSTPVEAKSAAAPSTCDMSKSQKPLSKSAKRRQRKQKHREAREASN